MKSRRLVPMYVIAPFFFFGIIIAVPADAADSLSLNEAVRIAVQNGPTVRQAIAGVHASEARAEESRTFEYPSANAGAGYTRIGPVPELFFPGLGSFKLFPENNYDAHVSLRQTLYDFGKVSATADVSESRVQTTRRTVDMAKLSLAYQTAQIFHTILFLQLSIDVQDEEIQTLNEHLLINRKREEAGTATDFDVLTTEVRVAGAENQRIELRNNLQKQRILLRRLLGLDPSSEVALRGTFAVSAAVFNADSLIALALNQRVEYAALQDEARTASLRVRLASLGDYPSMNFMVEWGVKNGFIPNLDILRGNWVAGFQVEVPLYEAGRTEQKKEEATADVEGINANLADMKDRIGSEVRQALSDVQAAVGKFETSELQVHQAKEAVSIARKRYEAGAISNLDLLDAETSLSQANLSRVQVLYSYVLSRLYLDHSIGTRIWEAH